MTIARLRYWLVPVSIAALAAHAPGTATAQSYDVRCHGQSVGTVTFGPDPARPQNMDADFSVNFPYASLSGVAAVCDEDHFNWEQYVTADPDPPIGPGGVPLKVPYLDPPLGGYPNAPNQPGVWADNTPGYWNEGPMPVAPFPPNWNPITGPNTFLDHWTNSTSLGFVDAPDGTPGDTVEFRTYLVSENANGTIKDYHGYFDWSSTFGANGGVTKVQRFAIPEPSAWVFLIAGLGMVGASLRHRRDIGGRFKARRTDAESG